MLRLKSGEYCLPDTGEVIEVPQCYRRPSGRGKYCGRMTVTGIDPNTGRKIVRRINCGGWTCSYCGPRRARNARLAIRRVADKLQLRYFITLTLDPKKLNPRFAVPYLRTVFNRFREYLWRRFREAPTYISVLEFTKAGIPHLHVLFDRYLPQCWISDVWASLGGGRIVDVRRVTIQRISRYLSKYLTKELLLSAPKGSRRITCARSIKLFPKYDSGISWELLRESIWNCLERHAMHGFDGPGLRQAGLFEYVSVEYDEESFLKAFQVHSTA